MRSVREASLPPLKLSSSHFDLHAKCDQYPLFRRFRRISGPETWSLPIRVRLQGYAAMFMSFCNDDHPQPARPRATSSFLFRTAADWQTTVKALAVATFSLVCAGCTETPANCRDEVAAAFERLRTSGKPYRRETTFVISDQQTYRETAEYLPPDRMREITDRGIPGDEPSEVIRIGARAWDRKWSKRWSWHHWESGLAQDIFSQRAGMDSSIWPDRVVPEGHVFECLGRVEFKGTVYAGYRARLPKVISSVSTSKSPPSEQDQQELMSKLQQMPQLWRTVLVDWRSALPAHDLVSEENQINNQTSEVHFTYPGDIKIEPPDQ